MQLLLATRKRVGNTSFRAAGTEIGDENMRRGISYLEPPANLVSCKWEFLPCKSLKGKRLQHGDPSWLALSLRSPLITLGMTNWRFHFPIMHHFFKSHRLTYTEPRDYRVVFGIQERPKSDKHRFGHFVYRLANNKLNRTRPKRCKSALFLENSLAKSALSFVLFQKISSNFHRFG